MKNIDVVDNSINKFIQTKYELMRAMYDDTKIQEIDSCIRYLHGIKNIIENNDTEDARKILLGQRSLAINIYDNYKKIYKNKITFTSKLLQIEICCINWALDKDVMNFKLINGDM
jgi:ribosomal protein S6